MNKFLIEKISNYISSQSRNRVIFHQEEFSSFESLDVGKLLSEAIFNLKDSNKLSMKTSTELDKILENGTANHNTFGHFLAISNLGILFESDLKIDFPRLLDKYSKNQVLFVKWDGEIDSDHLYFLSKQNGIKINIKNLSHIKI